MYELATKTATKYEAVFCILLCIATNINIIFLILILNYITVDIIINQVGGKTSITVKDTGIGIPVLEQSRVFERFYRVDKSHSKLVGGTGLGLAIVKHGAAYHDAEVSLESTEGKGTSVTITFAQ